MTKIIIESEKTTPFRAFFQKSFLRKRIGTCQTQKKHQEDYKVLY